VRQRRGYTLTKKRLTSGFQERQREREREKEGGGKLRRVVVVISGGGCVVADGERASIQICRVLPATLEWDGTGSGTTAMPRKTERR